MLPRQELLEGSRHREALETILDTAEQALRSWTPCWSGFIDGAVREDAEARLATLAELTVQSEGGHPGAERRRLLLQRPEAPIHPAELPDELLGLEISGNFLFDPSTVLDFRQGLLATAGVNPADLGDLWLRGDRGAQAIATSSCAQALDGLTAQVRSVEVQLLVRPIAALQCPAARQPRRFQSVEASLRLDAVASAGFGISRSRMAELIRQGELKINWTVVTSASREIAAGDRVQWSGRGELLIEEVCLTKRDRWRLQLARC